MTTNNAYTIFVCQFKNLAVLSCYEYSNVFVFQAVPNEYVKDKNAKKILGSLYSVNKNSGDISVFNPMNMSIDEYKKGKRVHVFIH